MMQYAGLVRYRTQPPGRSRMRASRSGSVAQQARARTRPDSIPATTAANGEMARAATTKRMSAEYGAGGPTGGEDGPERGGLRSGDCGVMIHAEMTTHAFVNPPRQDRHLDDGLLRLFADPLRARLLTLLSREQLCTCHLAEVTGSLPTAVSNHLRQLREAGVVDSERVGRNVFYRLRPEVLEGLGEQFAALALAARTAEKRPC